MLIGDAYADTTGGNDIMYGGGSNPAASYGDRLGGGYGNDTLYGGGNGSVFGEEGNDTLTGGDHDTVDGGAGNDTVLGAAGTQWINGGTGDDWLTGGAGLDRFSFNENWGTDVITDFNRGEGDYIEFYGVAGLSGFDQLAITNSREGIDVSFGANSIHMSGITADSVQSSWFFF